VLRIGAEIARGLTAAHARGLVHRDVKPANILLEEGTGKVKITDFGLARAIDDASLTQSGTLAGTPEYMAPEQAGAGPVDHRADLFSLGSVLYAMCTGRPPFRAERLLAVLRRTREETPAPIGQVRPEVPGALIAIVEKLHRKDPKERYATAAEALEQLQATPETPLARPEIRAGGEGMARRRMRRALLAASVLLAAALSASELAGITGITSRAIPRAA
jgi:serine/threonine protein kinase